MEGKCQGKIYTKLRGPQKDAFVNSLKYLKDLLFAISYGITLLYFVIQIVSRVLHHNYYSVQSHLSGHAFWSVRVPKLYSKIDFIDSLLLNLTSRSTYLATNEEL